IRIGTRTFPPTSPDRLAGTATTQRTLLTTFRGVGGPDVVMPTRRDLAAGDADARRMASKGERGVLEGGGPEVAGSDPEKVYFPAAGITKLEVVRYYLTVAEGALRGAGGRPNVLVRYADGIDGEFFYQKRAPTSRPPWIEVVALRFPSGREAEEIVPR